jgi:hypothetical protein
LQLESGESDLISTIFRVQLQQLPISLESKIRAAAGEKQVRPELQELRTLAIRPFEFVEDLCGFVGFVEQQGCARIRQLGLQQLRLQIHQFLPVLERFGRVGTLQQRGDHAECVEVVGTVPQRSPQPENALLVILRFNE